MSKSILSQAEGATPIDRREIQNLIPKHISNRADLNSAEEQNIVEAQIWLGKHSPQTLSDLLNATFVMQLHGKMFCDVWRWAGQSRQIDTKPGIPKENIFNELGHLLSNTAYWHQHKTFSPDEIAVRFHHRLVEIHIFTNGNGRHARLLTNLLLDLLNEPRFTWGLGSSPTAIQVSGPIRDAYIRALKKGDRGEFEELLKIARS